MAGQVTHSQSFSSPTLTEHLDVVQLGSGEAETVDHDEVVQGLHSDGAGVHVREDVGEADGVVGRW